MGGSDSVSVSAHTRSRQVTNATAIPIDMWWGEREIKTQGDRQKGWESQVRKDELWLIW